MTFTDNLSPYLVHFHLFGHDMGIRWYGMAYLFSFILVYFFFRRAALRGDFPNFSLEDVDNFAIRIVFGVMVGGRLGFVVQHPYRLLHEPIFLVSIWEGGMAFFGGLAGVILVTIHFAWQKGIPFLQMTDLETIPAAMGLFVGRLANFVNGELYGKPTHAKWGVIFPAGGPQPRHPSQLYEAFSHLILLGICYKLYERWRGKVRPGGVSYVFLVVYGVLRAITDTWRQDDTYWGPLSDGQWFSIGVAVAGAIALWYWYRRDRTKQEIAANDMKQPQP